MPRSKAFNKLRRALTKKYLGEKVPSKYVKRHGKIYNRKDIDAFSLAIAKARRVKY